MHDFEKLKQFQFVRHEKVYDGELVFHESDQLERSFFFWFKYNLRYSPWEEQKVRPVKVTEESSREKGFKWTDLPVYVIRAFDEIDARNEEFSLLSSNISRYLPLSGGLTIESAARVVAQHMYRFVVESDVGAGGLEDLRISCGLDKTLFDRSLKHLGRMGIVGVHPGGGRHTFSLKPNGGFEKLNEFRDAIPVTVTDFDAHGHRYFRNHYGLPDGVTQPFAFVLMPFGETEFGQEFYTEKLKPLVEGEFGRSCFRVDEDRRTRGVMDKVATFIRDAELVVAEISTLNPNVMYELGLAHSMDKETVVLWHRYRAEGNKPPFDLNRYSLIYYTDDDFNAVVSTAIRAALK